MKELKLINPDNVTEEEVKGYDVREAARAVVFDTEVKIALLHVSKENYYKLPGGGLEADEEIIFALERECKEEIGCEIEVINEIGSIIEYRKIFNLKQTSFCYLAKLKGEKGVSNFTDNEKEKGFEPVWLTYDEAIKALTESTVTNMERSSYIVPRDTAFLEKAKEYLTDLIIN